MTALQIHHPKKVILLRADRGRVEWSRILSVLEFYHPRARQPWRTVALDHNQNNIHGALKKGIHLLYGIEFLPGADFRLEAMK